jgi:hypothetical protein
MSRHFVTRAIAVCAVTIALAGSAAAQCCNRHKAQADGATAKAGADSSTCKAHQGGDKTAAELACRGKALNAAGAPLMQYKVGDQTTKCPQEADKLAAAAAGDAKIRYVVDDTEYADKTEALRAYAKTLDAHLAKLTAVRYVVGEATLNCPQAATKLAADQHEAVKYRLASFTFEDQAAAQQAADAAREAADNVDMKTLVDGQEVCSAKTAQQTAGGGGCCAAKGGMAAKKSADGRCAASAKDASTGKKCQYVVGDVKTPCEATAKVELAQTRILAAYNAIEEVASKSDSGKPVAAAGV